MQILLLLLLSIPPRGRLFLPGIVLKQLALNPEVQEEVGLTEEESDFIKDVYFDFAKKTEQLKSNIKIKEIELEGLLEESLIDFGKVKDIVKEIGGLGIELRLLQIEAFEKIQNKLGGDRFGEIRRKLKKLARERKFMRRKRMNR